MNISRSLRLSCLTACALWLTLPVFGNSRGGSDYGGSPTPCTGASFSGGSVVCGYFDGTFGGPAVDDTLFQFQLTNSALSVTSATIQFSPGASITNFGFVLCPLSSSALNTPCTTQLSPAVSFTIPTNGTGNPLLSSSGTLLVTFSNFSGLYSGSSLTQGVTIFFDEPSASAPFATVAGVTTSAVSATPEPASLYLSGIILAGFTAVAAFRRRAIARFK